VRAQGTTAGQPRGAPLSLDALASIQASGSGLVRDGSVLVRARACLPLADQDYEGRSHGPH
jgi:hypothetical protein